VRPGKKVVFGVGSLSADIFFCGEAPGADEEIQGEPFVGRAGQLLTKIIEAMGLFRSDVYIANVLNWRPEMPTEYGNRPPTREEMQFCFPYLLAQLEIVAPRVIVALGATASGALLGQDGRSMGEIRGRWHDFNGTPLMATYHPSYLLRYSGKGARRTVWEDILLVMERLAMPISEKQRGFFL
jgi:DNA polymerase